MSFVEELRALKIVFKQASIELSKMKAQLEAEQATLSAVVRQSEVMREALKWSLEHPCVDLPEANKPGNEYMFCPMHKALSLPTLPAVEVYRAEQKVIEMVGKLKWLSILCQPWEIPTGLRDLRDASEALAQAKDKP